MNAIWKWINKKELSKKGKIRLFLILNSIMFGGIGFFVWLLISRFTLSAVCWAICFVGYPVFFGGYVGGFIFLCRNCMEDVR